jgi:hypothetical protein
VNPNEALGIVIATIVALLLRWATDRWPGKQDAAAKRSARLASLQEQVEIKRLERELDELREDEA